ncbi:unnamed protein product, partial [Prorocentrum cordatum]
MQSPPEGEGVFRLDLGINKVAYDRTMKSLDCLVDSTLDPAFLSVLLEKEVKHNNRIDPLPLELSASGLNDAQVAAARSIEEARVSLIQGPPGCGKTRLASALLKAAYRGKPLLAAADSHVAVDRLMAALLSAGVAAVRFGDSARITQRDLVPYSVEVLAQQRSSPEAWRSRLRALAGEVQALRRAGAGAGAAAAAPGAREEALQLAEERLRNELKRAADGEQVSYADAVQSVLDSAEVVCATLVGCGARDFEGRSFDLILLDEASQSTEPRSLIPISRLSPSGRLALVGDHQQLPPVCVSREAESAGLGLSLFSRLLQLPPLRPAALRVQYRMHPLIRQWPSEAFYRGTLVDGESVVG